MVHERQKRNYKRLSTKCCKKMQSQDLTIVAQTTEHSLPLNARWSRKHVCSYRSAFCFKDSTCSKGMLDHTAATRKALSSTRTEAVLLLSFTLPLRLQLTHVSCLLALPSSVHVTSTWGSETLQNCLALVPVKTVLAACQQHNGSLLSCTGADSEQCTYMTTHTHDKLIVAHAERSTALLWFLGVLIKAVQAADAW